MIKSINVLSFGPINNAECDGLGQINLFIGHNGSGKTFLLKALYSALKTVEAYKRGKEQRTEKEILSDKLYWMFQSPALGELVRKGDNALQFTMKSEKTKYSPIRSAPPPSRMWQPSLTPLRLSLTTPSFFPQRKSSL